MDDLRISFVNCDLSCMLRFQRFLALLQAIWSVLLRNFDMELMDPFPEPDYQSMVVGPKSCRVRYRRRKL